VFSYYACTHLKGTNIHKFKHAIHSHLHTYLHLCAYRCPATLMWQRWRLHSSSTCVYERETVCVYAYLRVACVYEREIVCMWAYLCVDVAALQAALVKYVCVGECMCVYVCVLCVCLFVFCCGRIGGCSSSY